MIINVILSVYKIVRVMAFLENGILKIYHLCMQITVRTRKYTMTSVDSRKITADERPLTRLKPGLKRPEKTFERSNENKK